MFAGFIDFAVKHHSTQDC